MSNETNISSNNCLSLATMSKLTEGKLTGDAAAHAQSHISNCSLCADIMQDFTTEDFAAAERISKKVHKRVTEIAGKAPKLTLFEKLRLPIAAGTVGAILFTAIYVSMQPTAQTAQLPASRIEIGQPVADASTSNVVPEKEQEPAAEIQEEVEKATEPLENISQEKSIEDEQAISEQEVEAKAMVKAEKKLAKEQEKEEKAIEKEREKQIRKEEKAEKKATRSGKRVLKVRSVQILNKMFAGGKTNKKISPNDMPEFYGGQAGLERYIKKEMKAMVADNAQLRHKSVVLSFVVNQRGKVSDVQAMSGISKEIDSEAVKIVQNMPDWSSGKKGKIQYMMSITFE